MNQSGTRLAEHELRNLRAWRKHAELTMEQLAERADVNKNTISAAEHGHRVTRRIVRKLAAALDISVEQLLLERPKE